MIGSSDTQYTCNFVVSSAFSNLLLDFPALVMCSSVNLKKKRQGRTDYDYSKHRLWLEYGIVSTDYDYCMAQVSAYYDYSMA